MIFRYSLFTALIEGYLLVERQSESFVANDAKRSENAQEHLEISYSLEVENMRVCHDL